jgi:hypothetical protein
MNAKDRLKFQEQLRTKANQMYDFFKTKVLPCYVKDEPLAPLLLDEISFNAGIENPVLNFQPQTSFSKDNLKFMCTLEIPVEYEFFTNFVLDSFSNMDAYLKTSSCVYNGKLYVKTGLSVGEISYKQQNPKAFSSNINTEIYAPYQLRNIGNGLKDIMQTNNAIEFLHLFLAGNKKSTKIKIDDDVLNAQRYLYKGLYESSEWLNDFAKMPVSHCLGLYLDTMRSNSQFKFAHVYKELMNSLQNIHEDTSEEQLPIEVVKAETAIQEFEKYYKNGLFKDGEKFLGKIDGITNSWSVADNLQYKHNKKLGGRKK